MTRRRVQANGLSIDGLGCVNHFGAVVGHVDAVLEADAELAVDGDHRLVAEAHARRQRRLVAAHEVGPLVAVEADAVAGAVGQSRHLVVGTEAGVGDHLARRGVDGFARRARSSPRQTPPPAPASRGSRCRSAVRRLAEHRRARDVRLVAVDLAAAVHLDDVAFLQLLRLDAAVRERGERAEAHRRAAAGRAERAMRRGDVGRAGRPASSLRGRSRTRPGRRRW